MPTLLEAVTDLSPTIISTRYHSPVLEMAQYSNPSNVIINGGTFNSVQGDFHMNDKESESGMHNFRSVQKSILIDDPIKDFKS